MTATMPVTARRRGRRLVDRLARLGLGARGVVYLLVAWLAIRIAFLHSGQQADRQGAMRQIAHNTAGKAVLLAMAVGFFGYAAWRIVQAVSGFPDEDGAKEWGKRAVSAARALLYLAFAYSAARPALSGQSGSGARACRWRRGVPRPARQGEPLPECWRTPVGERWSLLRVSVSSSPASR